MTRTIVITGSSSGIGLAAAEHLATLGYDVVLVGRDEKRLAAAVERVTAAGQGREPAWFRADFERLADVRQLAERLLTAYPKIDALANNAGALVPRRRITEDGFEATIQGNHLAPFLLSTLLRERLRGGRIVTTASDAHRGARVGPESFTGPAGRYLGFPVYGSSKAANVLFASEAARRWPDITSVSFHPGVVRSNFGGGPLLKLAFRFTPWLRSAAAAGADLAHLITAPELVDGAYYYRGKPARASGNATDPALAARLWDASEVAVGMDAR
ncbi:SDR family NAD(P)-dependent oxidoreductase [Actinoplanes sp. NBRC 103695]|uniref:SDR family NAD(P)-dependent oxidoreductase n=1 Tax=Actinoplanes sp. NBRC 103695 TaxID=3032202 RepID=UPI0024A38618|nr:SDR family NAD(P)-dependent oxidoreductase [Actinoplanes sp. NBRC 103695]GLY93436.1 short-chain dehydrogenase [Actinoplanes sp. NBRC 103695]